MVFEYFWFECVVGIFGLGVEGRRLDLGLSGMKIWETSPTLYLKKSKYALLLDGQVCSSWILRELFFLAECWQGFLLLTLDHLLFSKESLFIGTLRLLHLEFPSQHLMGFDLILNLNLVFHLIKTFHMQDSSFDVATWFQSCDTWLCPIRCNLLTCPLLTRHHLTIDLINKNKSWLIGRM